MVYPVWAWFRRMLNIICGKNLKTSAVYAAGQKLIARAV